MRYLAVVDGIIGGEGNGPMSPDPRACGVIIGGTHPLAVDCVAATLMGFEWRKIRMLSNAFELRGLNFVGFGADQLEVVSNVAEWEGALVRLESPFRFAPHFGWKGEIERKGGAGGG